MLALRLIPFAILISLNILAQDVVVHHPASEDVKILFGGDIMIQAKTKSLAKESKNKSFNFLFTDIRDFNAQFELVFANLESPISKTQVNEPKAYLFNSPAGISKSLKWAGYNVINVANNHAYDQGKIGLKETLLNLRRNGVPAIGAGFTKEEAMAGRIFPINGQKIGFLGFAEFYNYVGKKGNEGKNEKLAYLNLLTNKKAVLASIEKMREKVDFLILSLHWGVEDKFYPTKKQMLLAKEFHDAGVDVIVGHHPHVLQPIKWYKRKDGKKCLTIYSLGNLVSNQSAKKVGPERESALVEITLSGDEIKNLDVHPIYTHNWAEKEGMKISLVKKEIRKLDKAMKELSHSPAKSQIYAEYNSLGKIQDRIYKRLGVRPKTDGDRGLSSK